MKCPRVSIKLTASKICLLISFIASGQAILMYSGMMGTLSKGDMPFRLLGFISASIVNWLVFIFGAFWVERNRIQAGELKEA